MTNTRIRLIAFALVQLTFIAAAAPIEAKPMITNKPIKVDGTTAKTQCAIMDGTFRYTGGGGWSCKMDVGTGWLTQNCNAKGSCTVSREPYKS